MNALADKAHAYMHKQGMPHNSYVLHNTATLFNNHPYIIAVNLVMTGVPLLLM